METEKKEIESRIETKTTAKEKEKEKEKESEIKEQGSALKKEENKQAQKKAEEEKNTNKNKTIESQNSSQQENDDSDNDNSQEKDESESDVSRPDYGERILSLIETTSNPETLKEELEDFHSHDLAEVIEELDQDRRSELFKLLSTDILAEILDYLDTEDALEVAGLLPIEKEAAIFDQMDTEMLSELLEQMPQGRKEDILAHLNPEAREDLSTFERYDDKLIGSRMSMDFIEIPRNASIKEAMRLLKQQAQHTNNIDPLYVVNQDGTYYGAIDLKDLIVARNNEPLESIISTSYPYFYAREPIDAVMEELRDYREESIPIVNEKKEIEGILTAQDMVDVIDEELSEDYARLAALPGEADLNEKLSTSLKKRLPWLFCLLALGLLVSSCVALFEGVVASLTILMVFQSLILSMSGNAGTQSLGVTIRVISDQELDSKRKRQFILKELRVGFTNGLIVAVISFCIISIYISLTSPYTLLQSAQIALCICSALFLAMTISAFTGVSFPLLLQSMHVDPAVASGPLITTINDLVGVCAYYGLAWFFLIHLLHL